MYKDKNNAVSEEKKIKLKEIITDFHERDLAHIYERDLEVPYDVQKVVSFLGPRRAGKTSLCLQMVKHLRQRIPSDCLTYINFEDDRLYPLALQDTDSFVEAYYELYPDNKGHLVYFFFDEVQEVDGWEKFVRRLHDQEQCRIYVTGSSSKLLSREIATSLRGRTLSYEVFPLSFAEYLAFNEIKANPNSSKGKALLQHTFLRFMRQGGFPELVFLDETFHRRTVSEYIDLMLYRDLVERFGVRTPSLLKYLLKYTLDNVSTLLSINKLYHDLKSQGYAVSKNTVYEYLSYLEEAFILFRVQRWSKSERQKSINPDKMYTIDPAFKYVMTGDSDQGRVLENMVFLALRRLGYEPNYWKGKQEVDFYEEGKYLINVCLDMTNLDTRRRELKGINEAMNATGLKKSVIVTFDQQGSEQLEGGMVQVVLARDFLLNVPGYVNSDG
ncbi:MAG: ATP-binding protein [Bacteroidota bacterium]